ncbi:CBS domain-containing protein [Halomicrobium zhouii]|uniref:CBS domain-containing protein n=1 Tax=Halomicrobium zhouii TaxID=767519 RepID=A0A1I6M5N3_9EURY|nr:CBS domain-containing protein [Halomicrobium zhouii]SFS10832.1 CBS domain-containing protein [Halomicrobium zhouii]
MPSQGAPPQGISGVQPQQLHQGGTQMPQPGIQPQPGGQTRRSEGMRMRPIRVEEVVEEDVVTAERDTPISEVVAKMAEEDVGSVVVVEDDQPVGVITDRSVALALENTPDIANKQAGDLVSGDLVTATTSMSVFDALQHLSDEGIRRLPIVDDSGDLQGIITLDDVLVLLGSELNKVGETIKKQSPRL